MSTCINMSSQPFPLPRAPQQCYSKWYNHKLDTGALKGHTILWVGSQLTCRFKSESINDNIGPHNVFILKKNPDTFAYAVIDNTDTIYRLPKKFFTTCFPGVQYNNIPPNNRIKIKLTRKDTIEVPYIPKSFLQQKKRKTSRGKRKRSVSMDNNNKTEEINFNTSYPEWHVLKNDQNINSPIQKQILMLMRNLMIYADNNDMFDLENPFHEIVSLEDIKKDERKMKQLKLITGFLFHFCRSELGCSNIPNPSSLDLPTWIGYLSNMAIV